MARVENKGQLGGEGAKPSSAFMCAATSPGAQDPPGLLTAVPIWHRELWGGDLQGKIDNLDIPYKTGRKGDLPLQLPLFPVTFAQGRPHANLKPLVSTFYHLIAL